MGAGRKIRITVVAHSGRGSVLYAREECDAALAEYDRAVELAPDFAGAPYNRALVLNTLRRYDEAIAAYQWAIAIKPDFAQAMFNCAVLHGATKTVTMKRLRCSRTCLRSIPNIRTRSATLRSSGPTCAQWDGSDELVSADSTTR